MPILPRKRAQDPDPVSIHLQSTADTTGIEEISEGLENLSEAERAAFDQQEEQRKRDVEIAQARKKAKEDIDGLNASVERLARAEKWRAIGQELRQLTGAVAQFSREFAATDAGKEAISGLSEEMQIFGKTASEVGAGVAQGYSQGGLIGGAIGGLRGLIQSVDGEWLDANARIMASGQELERATVAHTLRLQERRKEATDKAIQEAYAAERKELEGQREQLEQIAALREAKGDLAQAQDKLNDARAVNAGVPREAIQIENVGQKLTEDREALAADLARNREELQLLSNEAFAASAAYRSQVDATGAKSAEALAALEEMKAMFDKVGTAESNLAALKERLNVQEQAFTTGAQAELEEQKGRLLGTLSGQAEKLRSDLDAEITEKGNSASLTAKSALADLTKILGDRAVTESEVQQLVQIMERLRTTQEGKDSAVLDGLGKIATNGDTFLGILQRTVNEVGKHAERLRNLDSQMQGIEMRSGTPLPGR